MTVETITRTARAAGMELSVAAPVVGPTVTTYAVTPPLGTPPKRVEALADTFGMALGQPVRFAGTIGTALALEVPSAARRTVQLGEVMPQTQRDSDALDSDLFVPFGLTTTGRPLYVPLDKLPHLLVSGATGQGKSVFVNAILTALVSQAGPDRLRFKLIDPKQVELARYADLPHVVGEVATDVSGALDALDYAIEVMEERYTLMREQGVTHARELAEPVPALVVVIDELADLVMQARKPVEERIARLAGKARAAAVHLIVATQHPKREVLTGLIKANIPTRVAFKVGDGVASRVALDKMGAERLTGNGDGLVMLNGATDPVRFQSPYVSGEDVRAAVAAWERPDVAQEPEAAPEPPSEPVAPVVAGSGLVEQFRAQVAALGQPTTPAVTVCTHTIEDILASESIEKTRRSAAMLDERVTFLEGALEQALAVIDQLMKER